MGNKAKILVFDKNNNNVTNDNDWYIDKEGNLYFETMDMDFPLMLAEEFSYRIEMI